MLKVTIIIPTYNEENSIIKTLKMLEEQISQIENFDINILIFDSCSKDKTVEQVKALMSRHQNIFLLTEPVKTGLGSAYRQAMLYAITELSADVVFEFDGDGSHQPKYIKPMLAKITEGYDVIVGSRYVPGGTIPKNWAFHRKLLSKSGNWLAQLILSRQYKDYTSGFRGTRSSFLKKIDFKQLFSKNYAYKIDLFWRLHNLNAKIFEYPIEFVDRETGVSKFPRNNVLESLYVILRLRILSCLNKKNKFYSG